MNLKMLFMKWWPFCSGITGINVLTRLKHSVQYARPWAGTVLTVVKVYSLAHGRCNCNIELVIFKLKGRYLQHVLWICPHVNAGRPHWWLVSIGSGNGLVPSSNKPLPGPMLWLYNLYKLHGPDAVGEKPSNLITHSLTKPTLTKFYIDIWYHLS